MQQVCMRIKFRFYEFVPAHGIAASGGSCTGGTGDGMFSCLGQHAQTPKPHHNAISGGECELARKAHIYRNKCSDTGHYHQTQRPSLPRPLSLALNLIWPDNKIVENRTAR